MRGPYIFIIDGEEHAPSSFGKLRWILGHGQQILGDPDMLYAAAVRQAERVAFDLATPGEPCQIEIRGRRGRGGSVECPAAFVAASEHERGTVDLLSPNYKWGVEIRRSARVAA